jgi:ribosome-associated protein
MHAIQLTEFQELKLKEEVVYSASRSSGPGGQHVNKVSTKVELRFNIPGSGLLSDEQKHVLLDKIKNKITEDGTLIIVSQDSRSQLKNKELVLEKFYLLIQRALKPVKKRLPTKPTASSKKKRRESKKIISEKKMKRKPPLDESS